MARLIALLLILIASALLLTAQSPSPNPTAQHQTSTAQHHTTTHPVPTHNNQPSPKPTAAQSDTYTYNYYYPDREGRLTFIGQIATIASAVLLTIFTGGLLRTSILQWRAIGAQASIMRDQLEHTQRAFVSMKDIRNIKVLDGGGQVVAWRFITIWRNSGITPTKTFKTHVSIWEQPTPLPKGFWFLPVENRPPAKYFLAPQAEVNAFALEIPIDKLLRVRRGETFLYIYGWAVYHDILPNTPEHRTRFCLEIAEVFDDLLDPQSPGRIGTATHCEHNDAD